MPIQSPHPLTPPRTLFGVVRKRGLFGDIFAGATPENLKVWQRVAAAERPSQGQLAESLLRAQTSSRGVPDGLLARVGNDPSGCWK